MAYTLKDLKSRKYLTEKAKQADSNDIVGLLPDGTVIHRFSSYRGKIIARPNNVIAIDWFVNGQPNNSMWVSYGDGPPKVIEAAGKAVTVVGDLYQAAAKNTVIGRVTGYDPNITTRAGKFADKFAGVVNTAQTALAGTALGVNLAGQSDPIDNRQYIQEPVEAPENETPNTDDDLEASMPLSPQVLIGAGFFLVVILFILSFRN